MQKFTNIRRILPFVAILFLAVVMASSCNSTSKYGCPNKLESGAAFR